MKFCTYPKFLWFPWSTIYAYNAIFAYLNEILSRIWFSLIPISEWVLNQVIERWRERKREGEIAQSYYVWHFYLEYMNKIIIFLFMTVSMIISFLILNKFHCLKFLYPWVYSIFVYELTSFWLVLKFFSKIH